jgi:methylene-tetrahydromethanopterin dehydrogenase
MVATVEASLKRAGAAGLAGQRILIFGGTGPVGAATALLCARAGAETSILSHSGLTRAQEAAALLTERYGVAVSGADGSSAERVTALMAEADAVFNAAAAGVQVLTAAQIGAGTRLKVACDVNAVPPAGIEGIEVMDNGVPVPGSRSGALGLGALAVGNIKYKVQQALLRQMHEAGSPQYLGLDQAFESARQNAA